MAIPTTTVSGTVLTPEGDGVTAGRLEITLSESGYVIDDSTSDEQTVGGAIYASIGTDGSVSIDLVPNDEIYRWGESVAGGTYYTVRYRVTTPRRATWTETWSVDSAPDPVDIGSVTHPSASTPSVPKVVGRGARTVTVGAVSGSFDYADIQDAVDALDGLTSTTEWGEVLIAPGRYEGFSLLKGTSGGSTKDQRYISFAPLIPGTVEIYGSARGLASTFGKVCINTVGAIEGLRISDLRLVDTNIGITVGRLANDATEYARGDVFLKGCDFECYESGSNDCVNAYGDTSVADASRLAVYIENSVGKCDYDHVTAFGHMTYHMTGNHWILYDNSGNNEIRVYRQSGLTSGDFKQRYLIQDDKITGSVSQTSSVFAADFKHVGEATENIVTGLICDITNSGGNCYGLSCVPDVHKGGSNDLNLTVLGGSIKVVSTTSYTASAIYAPGAYTTNVRVIAARTRASGGTNNYDATQASNSTVGFQACDRSGSFSGTVNDQNGTTLT